LTLFKQGAIYALLTQWLFGEEPMNSKVTYLSSRSLAAYETMLIETYAQQHKREIRIQRMKVLMIWLGFTGLASLALILPLFIQTFLRMLWL
jgi:hypothetical protein